jgi:hypothetical protein
MDIPQWMPHVKLALETAVESLPEAEDKAPILFLFGP